LKLEGERRFGELRKRVKNRTLPRQVANRGLPSDGSGSWRREKVEDHQNLGLRIGSDLSERNRKKARTVSWSNAIEEGPETGQKGKKGGENSGKKKGERKKKG